MAELPASKLQRQADAAPSWGAELERLLRALSDDEELLDEAFALDRTEQVLQVAVAVSEADVETTAATTEILVDAVAAVVETLDADESSVEAAAVAAEVTSSTHLTAAAANTSLNSVGQLAALSTEVGITGVAADGLVGTLSNVLSVENLPPNATAALGESIDAIGAALVYDAVPGEKWRGVEKEHVALGAQSVKATRRTRVWRRRARTRAWRSKQLGISRSSWRSSRATRWAATSRRRRASCASAPSLI